MDVLWHAAFLLLCISHATANPVHVIEAPDVRAADDPYRLDTTVLPSHYDVTLIVRNNFGPDGSFTGTVAITLTAQADVQQINLHATYLAINTANIALVCGGRNLFGSYSNATTYHMITITSTEPISNGTQCVLTITDFVGILSDNMRGFYRSKYTNAAGQTEWLGTTQFQTTNARSAFPCFDEPSFKATFSIRIYHPSDYTAISNTPQLGQSEPDPATGLVITSFQTTPVMSVYLIAFIVSKFAYLENQNYNYRVFARQEAISDANYTLIIAPPLLESLEATTGIKYLSSGIGKLDQVAVPDFSAGAMENWGLLTYRERNLLWDPVQSSNSYKQAIAAVIAHELTHMWFGDLVTCQWWSYTWLNEGFARYHQYFTTTKVETTFNMDKQFVVAQLQVIFATDATPTVEAMTSNASTPSEVSQKFSSISYNKGASIIRMTEHFMGHDNWEKGIQDYLASHQFQSTVPQDLFDGWEPYARNLTPGRTFTEIMKTWTEQSGFPVLYVRKSGSELVITQKRFYLNATYSSTEAWDVPISYTTSTNPDFEDTTPKVWFPATSNHIHLDVRLENENDWIILNIQETGYYRVNYEDSLWDAIENALNSDNFGGIHVLNRAQIVDDVINLAQAGYLTYVKAFKILSYLKSETEYYPWYSALTAFNVIYRRIGAHETLGPLFEEYLTILLQSVHESAPLDQINDADHIYTLKKDLILPWVCRLGVTDCIEKAQEAFYHYHEHGTGVNANLRSVVYCNELRYANSSDSWYFLYNKYLETKLSTEENTIISALGCTQNETLLYEYLQKVENTGGEFRAQDISALLSSVYTQPYGAKVLYRFLKENFRTLPNYYSSWGGLFSNVAERFTTEAELQDLETFFAQNANELASVAGNIRSAIATARINIDWTTRTLSTELTSYFATYGTGDANINSRSILSLILMLLTVKLLR